MVDRGLPIVDGAPACPFVAFEDDRDARATAPDHRHRCYAEPRPAPRALAHQDAYCLSSNFPVCPTFQDWARREAAAARPGSAAPVFDPRQEPESPPQSQPLPPPEREPRHAPAEPLPPRRNPPRDWAAPPPWQPDGPGGEAPMDGDTASGAAAAAGFAAASAAARDLGGPPEARGLAGSAADRLAAGRSPVDDRLADDGDVEDDDAYDAYAGYDTPIEPATTTAPPIAAPPPAGDARGWGEPRATDPLPAPPIPRYGEPDDAAYVAGAAAAPADPYAPPSQDPRSAAVPPSNRQAPPPQRQPEMWSDPDADDEDDRYPYAPPPPRRYVDRARDRGAAPVDGRGAPQPGPKPPKDDGNALFGPAWERPRRYEAYPTLRSRMSVSVPLPGLSRVVLALGALALGVLVLFFLPGMLDLGGGGSGSGPTATSSSLASQTPEPSPTATPAPTPIVHVVAQGETLSKIAKRYGLTLDQVLAANPQIKNPNKIAIGDEIKIPTPPPSDDLGASQEPSAS